MDGSPRASVDDSAELWRLTIEHSPVGMAVVRADGHLLLANRSLCSMLDRSEAELRELTFHQLTHPEDLAADVALHRRALAGEINSYRLTKRYLRPDGSVVWGDLSATVVHDADGTPSRFISQVVDVSSQVAQQARLTEVTERIERERRLGQALLDTVDVGLTLLDPSGRHERSSRRHDDFQALAFPEGHRGWAGQTGAVFAADGRTPLTSAEMPSSRAVVGGRFDDYRIWVGDDPASRRALSVSARTVSDDADGTPRGVALAYTDVTDLVRAVEARDQFVASVSHELRTPLTSVLSHLELLLDAGAAGGEWDQDAVHSLGVAYRNSLRLKRLVSDLLASAQDRVDGLVVVRATVNVAALAREAVEAAAGAARQREVALHVHAPAAVRAKVDPLRFRQVLDNLVANAVTYTEPGGRVEAFVTRDDQDVVLEVRDTGIGIEPEDLPRVHEAFFRSPAAKAQSAPGLGLGLSVVHKIVEAHGGRTAISSTPGKGTSVEVRLPV